MLYNIYITRYVKSYLTNSSKIYQKNKAQFYEIIIRNVLVIGINTQKENFKIQELLAKLKLTN